MARLPHRKLSVKDAQRHEKVRRIWRELLRVYTPENAVSWLKHPVPVLENRRPIEVMAEAGGLDRELEVVGPDGLGHFRLILPDRAKRYH